VCNGSELPASERPFREGCSTAGYPFFARAAGLTRRVGRLPVRTMDTVLLKGVIPVSDLVLRLGLASVFGMLLGLDREIRGISAGVRTHMLVALSSATTMLIALELFEELSAQGRADPDPTRAIQGLAQAIGFLCAGVIFVARGSVYGLTTAASRWMTSSIGMAAGAGMYLIATVAVGFAFVIVTIMWVVIRLFPSAAQASEKDDR
jgi:putative Mg2+ transporter-C (MgtC) family protein